MSIVEETTVSSLPEATWVVCVRVGEVIRQRTHFLERTSTLVIVNIQVGINTPQQTVRFTTVGNVVAERIVPEKWLEAKVLEVLRHVVGGNMAHVKVKTDKGLSPPAKFLELEFHQVAAIHERRVKGATLLGNGTDEINFAEANPVALNHFFTKFAILLKRGRLGGARGTEVTEDFIHELIIAWFGSEVKGVNRPRRYG